ncbi:tetratricopeptide repeat protein [Sphingomonas japonica]|uniref:Zn-dependent protease n=1 Tax=Sphingomonas japonica TaxID=511662 RepID=A0ABX0U0P8_9SPHN|nr:tetratricopeptide repeat protein [Sphingomonas japonica]NIJ24084.1 putative Zn-dependent protease [Sphingomonas japonica]
MTSSPEAPPRPRRLKAVTFAILVIAASARILAAWPIVPHARTEVSEARSQLARALGLLASGSPTAARDAAARAVALDRDWGMALAVLARSELGLGDGIAAEAALDRSVKAGFDPGRLRHLYADAYRIQGQPDRALETLETADPRYASYSDRVRAQALMARGDYGGAGYAFESALRRYPRDAATWIAYARYLRGGGDISGAIAASARAATLAPKSADALALRGEMVRAQYGLTAALPWFADALRRDPNNHDMLIEYAATLGETGQTQAMLAAVRRAAAARPGSAQAYYLQAVLAARAGAFETARAILQRIGSRLDGLPAMLLLSGGLDLQAGGYQQAIEQLRALVDRQPMNIAARSLLATAYARANASRDAIAVLRPVIARSDADSYVLTLAARAFERIGDRGAAASLLDRAASAVRGNAGPFGDTSPLPMLSAAVQQQPDNPDAAIALIRGLQSSGDPAAAFARAQALAASNPGTPAAHLLVGDALMLDGQPRPAAQAYARAGNLRLDEATMLRLAEALDLAGNRPAAARTLALFLTQNPWNIAALRLSAHWQLAAAQYAAAIDTLEALRLRIGDRDAVVLAELAAAYTGAGDAERGLIYAQAAHAIAPANPAVADCYGWALREGGDAAGAVQLLLKAVALAPRHPMLRWHLAQAYADLGQNPRARAQAQAALADPGFGERAAAEALLAALA